MSAANHGLALDALAQALERGSAAVTSDMLADYARPLAEQREAAQRAQQAADAAKLKHVIADTIQAADTLLAERIPDEDERTAALYAAMLGGKPSGPQTTNLAALMRNGIPPVECMPGELARGLVYAVGVTGFSGHPESGKTSLVSRLGLDAIREGLHVVYLDWEQGEQGTVRRLDAVGATADDLEPENLTYVPFPGKPDWDWLGEIWDAHPGAVGIFDSTRGILRSLGLSENDASEAGQFMDALEEFAVRRKSPCLLIDHVTKAATSASGYGRGSGDKKAAVDALWYVDRKRAFSQTEVGEIELTNWKMRHGGLQATHRLQVGDGQGNLTFDRLGHEQTREGKMDAAIIEFLKGRDGSASLRDVRDAVTGSAAAVGDRVKALAVAEDRPVAVDDSGQAARYVYAPESVRPVAGLDIG